METSTIFELTQKLSTVGFTSLLVIILYGSYKGIWVWGRELRDANARADRWQEMALQAAGLAEKSVTIAKRTS